MPIPAFDAITDALPPHMGSPINAEDVSPYFCTAEELCDRFATTTTRKRILEGFLDLREQLIGLGIRGFQWLDGSFLEDIEGRDGRDPNDIDAITFIEHPRAMSDLHAIILPRPDLLDAVHTKANYSVDHYIVPLGIPADQLVDYVRYWYGLFSHRRDGTWKGMLVVKLVDVADDAPARSVLGGKL